MEKKLEKSGNFVSPEKWEPCITETWDLGTYPLLLGSGGHQWRHVQTCTLDSPPTVLTSSGGHRNTYGLQVD